MKTIQELTNEMLERYEAEKQLHIARKDHTIWGRLPPNRLDALEVMVEEVAKEIRQCSRNNMHQEYCPIYLSEHGRWGLTASAICNCMIYRNGSAVTWKCPRCLRIHHILKQTCDCLPPLTTASTTTPYSTNK